MRPDKAAAKAAGVPKSFCRYSARYGRGIGSLLKDHLKFPAPMLDHGRDRTTKRMGVASLPPRAPIEGVSLAS